LLVFSKVRDGNQRKICLSEKIGPAELVGPDGKGASVFIVDDLVRSGATLLETAKILRSMGAGYIGAAIVHIDFDPGRTLPFVKNGLINEIATTNSNPGKARALFLAAVSAGFKVCLSSIFDAGSRFRYRYSAGEAVPPCILASSSETKLEAVRRYAKSCYGARFPASLYGIYTGAVPSHVSEQPIGETEILAGAQNRYYLCRHLYGLGSQTVISFESGLKAPRFQDVAVGIMDGPDSRNKKWVDGPFVPADMVHSLETLAGKTVGEFLQRAHNLPSKDAWILHFSDTHTDRAAQLAKTLEQ
jgi:non-canonical (house-cleaning) NTP pyrophosphatase